MESNLNHIFELQYALDTFYFLICGALVMWMAAGFSMLEAGLVRAKNTTEILTKNVSLFAIAAGAGASGARQRGRGAFNTVICAKAKEA